MHSNESITTGDPLNVIDSSVQLAVVKIDQFGFQ